MSEPVAIRVENLYKQFNKKQDPVLRGVTYEFKAGHLTYILGSSGAGKSVLLKHILGLLKPDQGEVYVGAQAVSPLHGRELSHFRLAFGMLFQNSALFDDFTVFENVAFPLWEHTKLTDPEIEEQVAHTLAILGMKTGYDKLPNELSGGMRKRVGLARAIIRHPSVLLYDEPTTGLDPVTRTTVDELIETLKTQLKLTSLVISHDLPSALRLADEIAFLHQGKIVFSGTADEFRGSNHPAIKDFMNAETQAYEAFRGKS